MVSLTLKEQMVLRLMCEGHNSKEAARELGISPRTVEVHTAHIREKAGAKSLLHAVMKIQRNVVSG